MIIAVDWNSTIQDQIGAIIEDLWRRYGVRLEYDDFDEWDKPLGDRLGICHERYLEETWLNSEIQRVAPAQPGAAERLRELVSYHQVWIVTATPFRDICVEWLYQHQIWYDRIIFTGDKGGLDWDVLVDDRPGTLEELFPGRRVIRKIVPWNRALEHIPGFENWSDFRI